MYKYVFLLFFSIARSALAQDEVAILARYSDAPVEYILKDYTRFSGVRVDLVQGIRISMTVTSDEKLTVDEYLQLIEKKLNEVNIGLFPIGPNRLVAAWIDPALATPPRVIRRPRTSKEVVQKNQQEQRDAIRSGKPSMPVPLSKEMDDQHVREGILPPQKETNPEVRRFNSREELQAHLREQQMDAIRSGKEPLPVPLTPEMENQLMKEGVLEVGERGSNPQELKKETKPGKE